MRAGIQHRELVRVVVDPWIETGHHAACRVHIARVQVGQAGLSGARRRRADGAVDRQIVGFARQHQRIVERLLRGGAQAAFHDQRATDGVDPLAVERDDDLHVAAVAHLVVDAVDLHRLSVLPGTPCTAGEAQLRRDRNRARRRGLRGRRDGQHRGDHRAVQPVDRDHPAAGAGPVVGMRVDRQAQSLGNVSQFLAVLHHVVERHCAIQLQTPGLTLHRLAGQLHRAVGLQPCRAGGARRGRGNKGGAVAAHQGEHAVAHRDAEVLIGDQQLQAAGNVEQVVAGLHRVGNGLAIEGQAPGLADNRGTAELQQRRGHRLDAATAGRTDGEAGDELVSPRRRLRVGFQGQRVAGHRGAVRDVLAQETARLAQVRQQAGGDLREAAAAVGLGGLHIIDQHTPGFGRCRRALELDHGLRRGHLHLHRHVAAEVSVRVKTELGVVGRVGLRHHIHHHIGAGVTTQHHAVRVGLLQVVAVLFQQAVAEFQLAGGVERGGRRDQLVERVGVGLGVVGNDVGFGTQALALDHSHALAHQIDGVAIGLVLLHRQIELVRRARIHPRLGHVGEIRIGLQEVNARADHQLVGARRTERDIHERIGRIQAAPVQCEAGTGPVDGVAGTRPTHRREGTAGARCQRQIRRRLELEGLGGVDRRIGQRERVLHQRGHLHRANAAPVTGGVDVEGRADEAVAGLRVAAAEAGEPGGAWLDSDHQRCRARRARGRVGAVGPVVDLLGQLAGNLGQSRVGVGEHAEGVPAERQLPGLAGGGLAGAVEHHGGRGVAAAR